MSEEDELQTKVNEYKTYIDEHRENVKLAYERFLESGICVLTIRERAQLEQEINNHDMSKYSEEEFEAYRKRFCPCSFETYDPEEFRLAVEHHYLVNDHHPQNPKRAHGINLVACVHNVLDWIAVSYKFGNDVWSYYENSDIREKINPTERRFIESLLENIKEHEDVFYKGKDLVMKYEGSKN